MFIYAVACAHPFLLDFILSNVEIKTIIYFEHKRTLPRTLSAINTSGLKALPSFKLFLINNTNFHWQLLHFFFAVLKVQTFLRWSEGQAQYYLFLSIPTAHLMLFMVHYSIQKASIVIFKVMTTFWMFRLKWCKH